MIYDTARDGRQQAEPCAMTAAGCARCEVIDKSSTAGLRPYILAPKDADSFATLTSALNSQGILYSVYGSMVVISECSSISRFLTSIQTSLSEITLQSIRASEFSGEIGSCSMIQACLHGESLLDLCTTHSHSWVRSALQDDWLFSMFHPIVEVSSARVYAYEMLLRAKHPETGAMIGAGQIIEACDALKLQHQLDQRARKSAIRQAAGLHANNRRIFINFLPNTIYDPAICLRTTLEAAQEYGVDVHKLVFEIVETEKIADMEHLKRILNYYKTHGISTAVDDMGAGHTSMQYLRELEPDYVKIDRDIIVKAVDDAVVRKQLDSIVSLSKKLGIKVITEGVETEAQLRVGLEAGTDFIQGYLFAKPANPPQEPQNTEMLMLNKAA